MNFYYPIPISGSLVMWFTHKQYIVRGLVCRDINIFVMEVRQVFSNIWASKDRCCSFYPLSVFSSTHSSPILKEYLRSLLYVYPMYYSINIINKCIWTTMIHFTINSVICCWLSYAFLRVYVSRPMQCAAIWRYGNVKFEMFYVQFVNSNMEENAQHYVYVQFLYAISTGI